MKTTLHYQLKDFRRFVLDDLEKQGYVLAAGTDLMLADLEGVDDPEAVVMEVLVENREEVSSGQVTPSQEPGSTPSKKYKQDEGLSEEELAKKEARREQWRKSQAKKAEKKATAKGQTSSVLEQAQEVVAATVSPFQ